MKGVLIDGGGAAHRALHAAGQPFAALQRVALDSLPATNLEAYDLVVVPRSCDADMLFARRHQFARFLDRGGVLIAFGELWTEWLPGARWEPEAPLDTQVPSLLAPHPLLDEITADDLWWHREPNGWCCHGHVRPPTDAEVLVGTEDGNAWFYVDRTSTRGTIVSASNLDMDTHAHHGNAIARTLLERLMRWAAREAERQAARRRAPADRIAGFFTGVHFQRGFYLARPEDFVLVPAAELGALDLNAYPALWIPRESDQGTLESQADRIAAYLDAGGRLISLEEIDRPWLPGATWSDRSVDVNRIQRIDHEIPRSLGEFGPPWHAHGVLQVPASAEILIRDGAGGALLATYDVGKGQVLAGTIDADSHNGYGSPIPEKFIDALVAWARTPLLQPVG